MKQRVIASIAIFVVLVAALVVMRQRSGEGASMEKRIDRFLACVPDTLREGQKQEIRNTLEHFQKLIAAGKVAVKDQEEISDILDHYVGTGSITEDELHIFLAKVGYYSIRMTQENQDIEGKMKPPDHPLLETSGEVDSTTYR